MDDFGKINESETYREVTPDNFISEKLNNAWMWHVRLGHPSLEYLLRLQKTKDSIQSDVEFDESILDSIIYSRLNKTATA